MFSLNGTLKKSGSVGQWEMNQFIGMATQEMKADQKYSKVVGIKGGGGGYVNETEGAIKGGGVISMKSMNFRYNWVLAVKKLHGGSLHLNSYRFLWSPPTYLFLSILNIFLNNLQYQWPSGTCSSLIQYQKIPSSLTRCYFNCSMMYMMLFLLCCLKDYVSAQRIQR